VKWCREHPAGYRAPVPADTYEDALRFDHRDLADMSDVELWAELHAARAALARLVRTGADKTLWGADGYPRSMRLWLEDRLRAIPEAQAVRRARAR
jgi:hypothetical protein